MTIDGTSPEENAMPLSDGVKDNDNLEGSDFFSGQGLTKGEVAALRELLQTVQDYPASIWQGYAGNL